VRPTGRVRSRQSVRPGQSALGACSWAIASARRDRDIVSSARLILVISKRVSDLPGSARRLLASRGSANALRRPSPAIAAERHRGRRTRPSCWYCSGAGTRSASSQTAAPPGASSSLTRPDTGLVAVAASPEQQRARTTVGPLLFGVVGADASRAPASSPGRTLPLH
jgi:hypothetical protein